MKFAVGRYNVDFHPVPSDPAPVSGAVLEDHAFGIPPREVRSIWVAEISSLEDLLEALQGGQAEINLSVSGYWTGETISSPGERMYGLGVFDDPSFGIDTRPRPVMLAPTRDTNG